MLLAGSCFAFLSAELSNASERANMLAEAFKIQDDMDKVVEIINTKQQESKIAETKSADDKNYVVLIKKEDDGSYVRVAHFKKDKVGTKITEDVLLKVIEEAEKKLGESKDNMALDFTIGGTKYYAVIAKKDKCLVFNIASSQEEVNKVLGITADAKPTEEKKPEAAKTETAKPATEPPTKVEENKKPDSGAPVKAEENKTEKAN